MNDRYLKQITKMIKGVKNGWISQVDIYIIAYIIANLYNNNIVYYLLFIIIVGKQQKLINKMRLDR